MIFTLNDGSSFTYEVVGSEVVTPDATWIVNQTRAYTATLFACHPPGSAQERFVVHLKLAGNEVASSRPRRRGRRSARRPLAAAMGSVAARVRRPGRARLPPRRSTRSCSLHPRVPVRTRVVRPGHGVDGVPDRARLPRGRRHLLGVHRCRVRGRGPWTLAVARPPGRHHDRRDGAVCVPVRRGSARVARDQSGGRALPHRGPTRRSDPAGRGHRRRRDGDSRCVDA